MQQSSRFIFTSFPYKNFLKICLLLWCISIPLQGRKIWNWTVLLTLPLMESVKLKQCCLQVGQVSFNRLWKTWERLLVPIRVKQLLIVTAECSCFCWAAAVPTGDTKVEELCYITLFQLYSLFKSSLLLQAGLFPAQKELPLWHWDPKYIEDCWKNFFNSICLQTEDKCWYSYWYHFRSW